MNTEFFYIAGSNIDFSDSDDLRAFMYIHRTDEAGFEFYKKNTAGVKLIVEDGIIKEYSAHYISYEGDEIEEKKSLNVKLPKGDYPIHTLAFLERDIYGTHRIGGNKPNDFVLPIHAVLNNPFIYLGSIDTNDSHFRWMGLPVFHLAFPFHECNFGLFVDYSDLFKPILLNPENLDDAWFRSIGKLPENLEFEEHKFSITTKPDAHKYFETSEYLSVCIPHWNQLPAIPTCPKTGELMQFVCEIKSDDAIKIKDFPTELKIDNYLIFGDYGNLYVFFHPESKIAHYYMQW